MADIDLDAARGEFAALTGLFEDAAAIASAGQGIKSLEATRRQCCRVSTTMDRIRGCLAILERRFK